MTFAQGTEVPVERSRAEIERLVARYGASGYASGWNGQEAVIMFEAHRRRVRFVLTMPTKADVAKTEKGHTRHGSILDRALEQEHRRRWRALALVIKAKLEAVESKVTAFEVEFLAHIVDPTTGKTVGEVAIPALAQVYENGARKLPPLLGSGA